MGKLFIAASSLYKYAELCKKFTPHQFYFLGGGLWSFPDRVPLNRPKPRFTQKVILGKFAFGVGSKRLGLGAKKHQCSTVKSP